MAVLVQKYSDEAKAGINVYLAEVAKACQCCQQCLRDVLR